MTIKDGWALRAEITPKQAERERQTCFRQMNLRTGDYYYPKGAILTIGNGETDISGRRYDSVQKMVKRKRAIQAFITIPSKANTK